jgi:hypothetical protein
MRTRVKASAISAFAVLFVSIVAFGQEPASATQGQAITAGTANSETNETVVENTNVNLNSCGQFVNDGLGGCGRTGIDGIGTDTGVFADGPTYGVDAASQGTAVHGIGGTTGIFGRGTSYGVEGAAPGPGPIVAGPDVPVGVWGQSGSDGVWGTGDRNGVVGRTLNDAASGVYGENQGNGYGVAGRANTGTGVFADTQSGTSLLATAVGGTAIDASTGAGGTSIKTKAPNSGTALSVTGKAKFSRSGVVTIAAGSASAPVTLAGVNSNSMILATSQQTPGPAVKAAVPGSGSFTIYLTANAPAGGLKVAYLVLN